MPAGVEEAGVSFLRVWQNFSNSALIADVLFFLLAQLGLVFFGAVFIFLAQKSLVKIFSIPSWAGFLIGAGWVFAVFSLLNSIFYPLSAFAFPVARPWVDVVIFLLMIAYFLIVGLASIRGGKIAFVSVPMALSIFLILGFSSFSKREESVPPTSHGLPNVIVLGVDAMRPSELAYFGGKNNVTPFVDSLLKHAKVYYPAYTPVARTYPAWVSILTGQYPVNNGARFNLTEDYKINKNDLISVALQEKGYHTVWALDERRFNSIDDYYGFDDEVGPKMGAADFAITKISDIPPVNVVLNTWVGRKIFPFLYNNRGNYVTYVPYLFNDEILEALGSDGPFFLAAHFCLPHYPFVNNLMPAVDLKGDSSGFPENYHNYLSMLRLADKQVEDFFNKMAERGLLENTVVYLVSDHGEGFPGVDAEVRSGNPYASFKMDQFGHGTNVLSLPQYEVLISKIFFKNGEVFGSGEKVERLSSLVDIGPDIARLLDMDFQSDGVALDYKVENRNVYIESSFSPTAVSSSRINEVALLQQAMDAYVVDPKGELRLAPRLYDALNAGKQRALVSSSGVVVAIYPDEKNSAFVMDKDTSTWWPSVADIPGSVGDWQLLLSELCDFNESDPDFHHPQLCGGGVEVVSP